VKLLRPEVTSGENIARFEREVQLTSQLTHPNTIAIYDYGRTPDGIFYYAMEYLPGITLDRLSEQDGPQPEARVIHILAQASSSLAEAHNSGLIHRDIKPSNIMLCERGGTFDVVKVLDFGLVKEVDQSKDAGITGVNTITGTPLYLSPEAIRASDLDGRSDLYSLGAVGYYLLTGEHVFTGEAAIEVFSHHLTTEVEPPSARLGREISKDLEEIILSCLQKDRDSRPEDANALRLALEDCRDSGGWGHEEARVWWEEHPALAAQALKGKGETPDSARLSESFAVALEDRVRS
jgi:serine/threonine-protein kinase